MTINLTMPITHDLKPRITVVGVGGAGGNAVNNMITSHLEGVDFVVCNTDAQALAHCLAERKVQLGASITHGLGAGARPEIGRAAAEESLEEVLDHLQGSNMVFITAGMGGGTGTGAAPVIARAVRELGILTVGVVTKPFHFEGAHRMRLAEAGIEELQQYVDTLIVIPNQNLFRLANERTTFREAFRMADEVLHMGVRGITDLIMMPGLINLDFADIRTVMSEMGKAMMGTGEAGGERRALEAAEAAISNPLLDEVSMKGARGVLINITGGSDLTLYEVDEAANRIREEVDPEANIIFGAILDETMEGRVRVSVVATGIEAPGTRREETPATASAGSSAAAAPRPVVPGFRFEARPHSPPAREPAAARSARSVPNPATTLARQAFRDEARSGDASAPESPSAEAAPAGTPRADTSGGSGDPADAPAEPARGGFFDRVRDLARGRMGLGGAATPQVRPGRPLTRPAGSGTPRDEIEDIPAFLRRTRVDS